MDEILAGIFKRLLGDPAEESTGSSYVAIDDYRLVVEGRVFITEEEYDVLQHLLRED